MLWYKELLLNRVHGSAQAGLGCSVSEQNITVKENKQKKRAVSLAEDEPSKANSILLKCKY